MKISHAEKLIDQLQLKPLPLEGGFFRETYRSELECGVSGAGKLRASSTCIYFMITSNSFSAFHKLPSDEIWHFYCGDSVKLHTIDASGNLEVTLLGSPMFEKHAPQMVVRAGQWQAAKLCDGGTFALLGCTVSPGFDFEDYVHGNRNELLDLFPQHSNIILQLTRRGEND